MEEGREGEGVLPPSRFNGLKFSEWLPTSLPVDPATLHELSPVYSRCETEPPVDTAHEWLHLFIPPNMHPTITVLSFETNDKKIKYGMQFPSYAAGRKRLLAKFAKLPWRP